MQIAQPITFGFILMAWFFNSFNDFNRNFWISEVLMKKNKVILIFLNTFVYEIIVQILSDSVKLDYRKWPLEFLNLYII